MLDHVWCSYACSHSLFQYEITAFDCTNENRYASIFGGLYGSTSMPMATMTRNINKQQPTKNTLVQWRKKRIGGATGRECGGSALRYDFLRELCLQSWCWEYHTLSMQRWEYDTLSMMLTVGAAKKTAIGNHQYRRFTTAPQRCCRLVCRRREPSLATLWSYW